MPFRYFFIFLFIFIGGCAEPDRKESQQTNSELTDEELNIMPEGQVVHSSSAEFETIDWDYLIPEDDLAALMTPPDYISEIKEGSLEDTFERQIETAFDPSTNPYQQALVSTKVIAEMDGQRVKLPGFVVPISVNEQQLVTEFFIVPYFGACLHMPPPPPNQIVYGSYPQGLVQPSLYEPFWLSGQLKTQVYENDMALAAYEMRVVAYERHTE